MIFDARKGKIEYTDAMERKICYQIKAVDLPCQAGQILRGRMGLTAHQIRSAKFRPGGILVNQKPARVNLSLAEGDELEVLLEGKQVCSHRLEASFRPLDILYEDEDLLAVNKPAGVALHPAHGHYRDTLSNAVQGYYEKKGIATQVRPIGRLDRDTSGIVLFAKNSVAAARLWERGSVQKEYLALVTGRLEKRQGSIDAPIGKKAGALNEMELSDKGKNAKTNYQVLEEFQDCSLVSLTLETGRTHQIRLHMASLGHPLVGDPIYGKYGKADVRENGEADERENGKADVRARGKADVRENGKAEAGANETRAALHCWRVTVWQPFTGQRIELQAPLPEDMRVYTELWK